MRSWLILVVTFTASEAAQNCVTETDWVECTCMNGLEHALFTTQHTRSQNGKWTNQVAPADPTCNSNSTLQWLREIYDSSLSVEVSMKRKGYERLENGLYKFHTDSKNWENARRTCEEEGAHLAIINSEAEAALLAGLFSRHPTHRGSADSRFALVGFHDLYNEGEFLTIFGVPLHMTGYIKWWASLGTPEDSGWNNNGYAGEDCGCMSWAGDLNDAPCDYFYAFICELEDNPFPPPQGIDYSAGAYIGVEKVIKPPPGTVQRTEPGEGYQYFPGVGFYRFHTVTDLWENARRTCEKEGAHLAIVNSEAEAQALIQMFTKQKWFQNSETNDHAFIGFHDQFKEGEYLTIYGEPLISTGYVRWAPGAPNNAYGSNSYSGQDCGGFYRLGGYDDLHCSNKYAFFCEKELLELTRLEPGEGYEFFPGVGFYRLHTTTDVWENARRMCEKEGAHLAIVNSESEAQVLIQMFKQRRVIENAAGIDIAFVGFHDQINEGEHLTIYGEPLSSTGYYRWWNTDNPDDRYRSNIHSGQDCGAFYRHGGYDDLNCNMKYPFFCEKELLE